MQPYIPPYQPHIHTYVRTLRYLSVLLFVLLLTSCSTPSSNATSATQGAITNNVAGSNVIDATGDTSTDDMASISSASLPSLSMTATPSPELPSLFEPTTPTSAPVDQVEQKATSVPVPRQQPTPAASTPPPNRNTASLPRGELLFLKDSTLIAYDVRSQTQREIASGVSEFAVTPNGERIAMVGTIQNRDDIWVVERDGSNLRRLTNSTRAEAHLSWAPEGARLVYASSQTRPTYPLDWNAWAAWCSTSQVRMLDLVSGKERVFEAGCDPAFSNDGMRIAFATPPQETEPVSDFSARNKKNTIRLINHKGEHGWSFAVAGSQPQDGKLVYAPAWSPDDKNIAYNRFIGYQALVDINYIEVAGSFAGRGDLAAHGAGWVRPPRYSPNGDFLAVVSHDKGNARGVMGYEMWNVEVIDVTKEGSIYLPEGERKTVAAQVDSIARATSAAWSPNGDGLALLLPPNWQPNVPRAQPRFEDEQPGEIWYWQPGTPPTTRMIRGVDYASHLEWLPAQTIPGVTSITSDGNGQSRSSE